MEVKCPQCGRVYDLPETKISRSLKCLCKFTFRCDPTSQTTSNTEQKEYITKNSALNSLDQETPAVDSNESNISEVELDGFLHSLRKSRAEIKERESKIEKYLNITEKQNVGSLDQEIEIDLPRKSEDTSTSELNPSLFEETSESSIPRDIEVFSSNEKQREQLPETPRFRNQLTSFLSSRAGILSMVSVGIIGILSFALFSIFSSSHNQKEQDPYLSELLKGNEPQLPKILNEPKSNSRPAPVPEKPKLKSPTQDKPTASVRTAKPKKSKEPAVAGSGNSGNIEKWSLEGNYESILDRFPSYQLLKGSEQQAHYFEAVFLSKKSSTSEKAKAREELKNQFDRSRSSSFARALAVSDIGLNNQVEAIKKLKNLQLTRSRDPFVFGFLGLAYERLKRPKLALGAYSQAVTLQPNFPWVLSRASHLAVVTKQNNLALDLSERLVKLAPQFAYQGHYQLGLLHLNSKNTSRAEAHLEKSIRAQDSFESRYLLGQIYLARNPKKSELHLSKSYEIARNSTERRNALFLLGQAQCKNKNHSKASYSFQKALEEDRSFTKALEEKAKCETELNLHEQASRTYQSILKTKPQDANVWLAYGGSLRQAKRYKPALAAVKRSLELQDSDSGHYELALIYLSLNRRSEATYHAKRAFRMNPKNKKAKNLLASLQ